TESRPSRAGSLPQGIFSEHKICERLRSNVGVSLLAMALAQTPHMPRQTRSKTMTFSIAARCPETGQFGIAISSSSIAVGARCPWLLPGVGAVSTQNITLPSLGPEVLTLMEQGLAPAEALDKVLTRNGYSQYRQITAIDHLGRT